MGEWVKYTCRILTLRGRGTPRRRFWVHGLSNPVYSTSLNLISTYLGCNIIFSTYVLSTPALLAYFISIWWLLSVCKGQFFPSLSLYWYLFDMHFVFPPNISNRHGVKVRGKLCNNRREWVVIPRYTYELNLY